MNGNQFEGESFASFTLGEYLIGISTDAIFDDFNLNYRGGKYLTLLNSFIPAGSYILPGGDNNSRIPLIPKVSYLVESVNTLILRIGKVGRLTNPNITLSNLEASPLVFAWSDKPIFTDAPNVTSSIETFITGATHSQVDTILGRISGLDLRITFLSLYPLIGIPAFNFTFRVIEGDPSPTDDSWLSLQVFGLVQGLTSLIPAISQGLSAVQASGSQQDYAGLISLRSEISHNIIPAGFGGATDSDAMEFNITPTNQFSPSRSANIAFSENVLAAATDVLRVNMPGNFFCETIIMSANQTVGGNSTVAEQFILSRGGTVDNIILTLASGSTQQVTQLNRIISETLEFSLVANGASATEFVIEFRGQVVN